MEVIRARNVNHALPVAIQAFQYHGSRAIETPSRNGPTLEWDSPVTTLYFNPMERVLFDPIRDANPFFHLMESMWILAGRRDVSFLAHLLPNIKNYSDDGERFHGAYGYRLRAAPGGDQLQKVAKLLKADPGTRRAVCSIWDPELDLGTDSADIPCNDLLVFRVRDERLDLTVYNRSNDMIWGAYGTNAVQFAFILEYVASSIGIPTGHYYQVSNSFHVYVNDQWQKLKKLTPALMADPYEPDHIRPAETPRVKWMPIGNAWQVGNDLSWFFHQLDREIPPYDHTYKTEWLRDVILPVWATFQTYKEGHERATLKSVPRSTYSKDERVHRALDRAKTIAAEDWRLAIEQWLTRRAA